MSVAIQQDFAKLVSLCAEVYGGSRGGAHLVGVWAAPVKQGREPGYCDIGRCPCERSVMLAYLHCREPVLVFLCRDHAVEMASPKTGDLLHEFTSKVLGDKDRETLTKAQRRPSKSRRLREYGLTTSAGTLTALGHEAVKRLPASSE